jgi:deaminated glutathione amidase
MIQKFTAACIQNCATPDVEADIAILAKLVDSAAAKGAELIALPEYCAGLDAKNGMLHPFAVPESDHPVLPAMAARAKAHKAWILVGSIGVKSADGRIFNRGYMLSPDGAIAARYDKIHMFDVDLGEGHVYRESITIMPGKEAVLSPCIGGPIGLSICYDLRFASLYRTLATRITGKAHWHILNRARAIENGAYVIAPCQYGTLAGGSECYGHSLIIDPWGRVLADGGEAENVITAEIDLAEVAKTRARIPSLTHDRPFTIESITPAVAAE